MRAKDLDKFTGNVHLYPGWTKSMSPDEHEQLAGEYEAFIEANVDRLSTWVEYDGLSPDEVLKRRKFYEQFDEDCVRPVWRSGTINLESLAEMYPQVLIAEVADGIPGLLRTLSRKYDTSFHVLGSKYLGEPFRDVYTTAWTSAMRHGETLIYDGELKRFPRKMQDVRATYRSLYKSIGLDAEAIVAGKPKEVSKLAIWSLQRAEEASQRPTLALLPTHRGVQDAAGRDDPGRQGVDNHPAVQRTRKLRNTEPLPVVSHTLESVTSTDPQGNTVLAPVLRSGSSMRACDTCFIASNCPKFEANATCAFAFSPEIRSRDQVISLLQTVIETQTERVFFARMVEQVNGDYPDPTVGKEIDRLMGLVTKTKELEDNKEFLRLTVERQTSGGILSALFGHSARHP